MTDVALSPSAETPDAEPDPVPNLPLLRRVLAQIDAYPETWEQDHWATEFRGDEGYRTAFCVAGWAVVLSGGAPQWEPCWTLPSMTRHAGYVTMPDGTSPPIMVEALDLLGLTSTEADALFDESNTRTRVQTVAERIAARAGERL